MRILHLIDSVSPQAHSSTLAMLADAYGRLGDIDERVYLLGGDQLSGAAEAAGLRTGDGAPSRQGGASVEDTQLPAATAGTALPGRCSNCQRVGAPMGRAIFAWPSLRRALRRNDEAPFDLIHCWSLGALALATLMFRSTPRIMTVTVEPTSRQIHWLRVLTGGNTGRTALLPIASTIRRSLLSRGVNDKAVHVLRPAIDMSRVESRSRRARREKWGLRGPVDSNILVMAMPADPPTAVDAITGAMVGLLVRESLSPDGWDVRLLMHPQQRRRLQAKSMLRDLGALRMLIDEPGLSEPWSVLGACDLALALSTQGPVRVAGLEPAVTGSQQPWAAHMGHGYLGAGASADDGGAGLSLLWAMAANIPIVGEATYAISEIVEDRHTALLARPGQYRAIAHRVRQIVMDKQLAWQLRDTARHECYSFFSRRRYCDSLRAVYGQMVQGRDVEVPQMESTGGLRFSGRG